MSQHPTGADSLRPLKTFPPGWSTGASSPSLTTRCRRETPTTMVTKMTRASRQCLRGQAAGMGEDGRAVALDMLIEPMPGLARRPDPNSNARLWGTVLFTGRPVGFLELYPFLPD